MVLLWGETNGRYALLERLKQLHLPSFYFGETKKALRGEECEVRRHHNNSYNLVQLHFLNACVTWVATQRRGRKLEQVQLDHINWKQR